MQASFIQFSPALGNLNATIEKIENLAKGCSSAELVVLPELANSGYNFRSKQQAFETAEDPSNSTFIDFLTGMARENNQYIVSGFNEKENGKLYNSSVLISPKGIIGKYRKIHLFMNEKDFFEKGNLGLPVFDVDWGKLGMLVCFDWMFPEVWRILALKGADIICHPSNLVLPYAQKIVPSHALLNKVYTITTNRIGTEDELSFTGATTITNPKGEILYQAKSNEEETAIIELDLSLCKDKMITPRNDIFADRRPDLYKDLINVCQ